MKNLKLRYPALFEDFESYTEDLTNEELGEIFRLAMKKEISEIKHEPLRNLFAALALHRGLEIWRTNDFYVKHASDNLSKTLIYLGKNKDS